jgi:hypothetical protein
LDGSHGCLLRSVRVRSTSGPRSSVATTSNSVWGSPAPTFMLSGQVSSWFVLMGIRGCAQLARRNAGGFITTCVQSRSPRPIARLEQRRRSQMTERRCSVVTVQVARTCMPVGAPKQLPRQRRGHLVPGKFTHGQPAGWKVRGLHRRGAGDARWGARGTLGDGLSAPLVLTDFCGSVSPTKGYSGSQAQGLRQKSGLRRSNQRQGPAGSETPESNPARSSQSRWDRARPARRRLHFFGNRGSLADNW